ncbi:CaiB/BaiF CoA transferase family protein [Natrinema gelatinilyticum]|uniref:CaiB/BaiF CoA transferase family protein n=1 Tax=Natrinema gelatinilyticum TaxID=2961571 RepID=UPI0020C51037|nr:CoA transferase [Natrinema gelatinilyticum]
MKPLDNIRVLSLGQYMSAPYSTMLLADMGAEVIKVERPGTGDPRRSIPPFPEEAEDEKDAIGGGFMAYNRNKKSVVLDLQSQEGLDTFKSLAEEADVVVENVRPGVTEKLGIDYETLSEINSGLVYAAVSGFGKMPGYRGPDTERPAFDIVVEAMSGMMQLVGFEDRPPQWTIYGLADLYSGMVTAYSIMLALFMRERTGEGQYVDTAMYDSMLSLNERMVMLYSFTDEMQPRGRLRHQGPRRAYEAQDGYVALNIPNDALWERLCKTIDRGDLIEDSRTADGPSRAENDDIIRDAIEGWLSDKTREEACEIFNNNGVPTGPVQTAEDVFDDPQVEARNMLVDIEDPEYGTNTFARTPMRLSKAPEIKKDPAPRLGEHTESILRDVLGYSDKRIEDLKRKEVIVPISD